jgi:hypothetical protein
MPNFKLVVCSDPHIKLSYTSVILSTSIRIWISYANPDTDLMFPQYKRGAQNIVHICFIVLKYIHSSTSIFQHRKYVSTI